MAGKEIRRISRVLLSAVLAGYVLLTVVYTIPESALRRNLAESFEQMSCEAAYPRDPVSGRQLDNQTDSLMLLEIRYDGHESAFLKAVNVPHAMLRSCDTPHETVTRIHLQSAGIPEVQNYSRYWHGYLVFLRPLLVFFNYGQIRTILALLLAALITAVAMLMADRTPRCVVPFLLSILLLGPTAIAKNLEFSIVTCITLVSLLVVLQNPRRMLERGRAQHFFLLVGIAVAYFDFLTFPTVALTMPLMVLCLCTGRSMRPSAMVQCVVCWGIGYAGMWAGKWLIAFAFNGTTFLDSLFSKMRFRAGTTGLHDKQITRIGTVIRNIRTLFQGQKPICAGIACCTAVLLVKSLRGFPGNAARLLKQCAAFALPAFIAPGWLFLLSNHSWIHYWFTYRTLVPCVFGFLCSLDRNGWSGEADPDALGTDAPASGKKTPRPQGDPAQRGAHGRVSLLPTKAPGRFGELRLARAREGT